MTSWTVALGATLWLEVEAESESQARKEALRMVEDSGLEEDDGDGLWCRMDGIVWAKEGPLSENFSETRGKVMEEARSSWNTVYQAKQGFECQITLRDQDETDLIRRTGRMMEDIVEAGGLPLRRKGYVPGESPNRLGNRNNGTDGNNNNSHSSPPDNQDQTYVDEQGVRRCGQTLQNGEVCGAKVNLRDGKYGPFWACPSYRQHA